MKLSPKLIFNLFQICAVISLFLTWLNLGKDADFILILVLTILSLIRYRFKGKYITRTIFCDLVIVSVFFLLNGDVVAELGVVFVLFQAMFYGFYAGLILIPFLGYASGLASLTLALSSILIGLVLNFWTLERKDKFEQQNQFSKKNYELESLQNELITALSEVEQMSIISERSRISRDIHDNAGHEIVAAYITLQTVRKVFEKNPQKALQLFDKSMKRLDSGVKKMRNAVHNMSAVVFMGIDKMQEICNRVEKIPVEFKSTGDMTHVTSNMWNVLESVLNESLTNVMKHSNANKITVELDATKYLIRLQIENDGIDSDVAKPAGNGIRNLRHRVMTVGGNLTVDAKNTFKVVCVINL